MDTDGRGKTASTSVYTCRLFNADPRTCSTVSERRCDEIEKRLQYTRYCRAEKTRFNRSRSKQLHPRAGLRHGIYRGYWAGFATYGPFSAIYFVVYEQWKVLCVRATSASSEESLSMPFHLAGGVLAGAVAAIATSPIDAIKTRMQASTPSSACLAGRPPCDALALLPAGLRARRGHRGDGGRHAARPRHRRPHQADPPPPPLPPLPRVWLRHACVGHHFAALVRRSVALMKFPE